MVWTRDRRAICLEGGGGAGGQVRERPDWQPASCGNASGYRSPPPPPTLGVGWGDTGSGGGTRHAAAAGGVVVVAVAALATARRRTRDKEWVRLGCWKGHWRWWYPPLPLPSGATSEARRTVADPSPRSCAAGTPSWCAGERGGGGEVASVGARPATSPHETPCMYARRWRARGRPALPGRPAWTLDAVSRKPFMRTPLPWWGGGWPEGEANRRVCGRLPPRSRRRSGGERQ